MSIRYHNAIFAQSVVTTHFLHSALALLGHSEKHPVKTFKVRFTRHYGFLTQATKRIIYTKFNSLNTFLHAALSLGFTHSRTGCSSTPSGHVRCPMKPDLARVQNDGRRVCGRRFCPAGDETSTMVSCFYVAESVCPFSDTQVHQFQNISQINDIRCVLVQNTRYS